MKQQVSVKAIIKKDRRVLLVRPVGSQLYQLPGSELPHDLQPREALQGILKAQVGQSAETLQLSDVFCYIDAQAHDTQEVVLLFLASLQNPDRRLTLGDKYDHYEWKLLSDIQLNIVDPQTRQALQLVEAPPVNTGAQLKIVDKDTTFIHKEVLVYTDGGSRGNPGPSAAGFVVYGANEELLFEGGKYLGITTNNQAEYQAVKLGLEKAIELGARVVKFKMDSQLIVNQMLGIYQIKNRDLWPIYTSIKEMAKGLDAISFQHVKREFNKEADGLVNKVLDERGK